jgi:hypothetical protein
VDELQRLQSWYQAQCDGDWEHASGIEIGTLDNPGWRVKINLAETSLEKISFQRIEVENSSTDWYQCWTADSCFNGAGGPESLRQVLRVFLDWSDSSAKRS